MATYNIPPYLGVGMVGGTPDQQLLQKKLQQIYEYQAAAATNQCIGANSGGAGVTTFTTPVNQLTHAQIMQMLRMQHAEQQAAMPLPEVAMSPTFTLEEMEEAERIIGELNGHQR